MTTLAGETSLLASDGFHAAAWDRRSDLIGLTAAETDVSRLKVEIVRTDLDLEVGRMLEAQVGARSVLYQLTNGLTKEEILQQKNTRGYVCADARKIGSWNDREHRFEVVNWVPRPNAPVFLVGRRDARPPADAIGHVPGTDYPVFVDLDLLVTHNAAILGVLGAGKSFLAMELVERMICQGIKVICLDLTGQYASELSPYCGNDCGQQEATERLNELGKAGRKKYAQDVEEGGSTKSVKAEIVRLLKEFLNVDQADRRLRIFNPARLEI